MIRRKFKLMTLTLAAAIGVSSSVTLAAEPYRPMPRDENPLQDLPAPRQRPVERKAERAPEGNPAVAVVLRLVGSDAADRERAAAELARMREYAEALLPEARQMLNSDTPVDRFVGAIVIADVDPSSRGAAQNVARQLQDPTLTDQGWTILMETLGRMGAHASDVLDVVADAARNHQSDAVRKAAKLAFAEIALDREDGYARRPERDDRRNERLDRYPRNDDDNERYEYDDRGEHDDSYGRRPSSPWIDGGAG
jgi:hypothetical protein